ncbi:response regulator [Aeromonas veronii]
MRILIVDDDVQRATSIKNAISEALLCREEDIRLCSNAYEAKKLVRLDYYDILILDVVLPNNNEPPSAAKGLTFLKEITRRAKLTKSPIKIRKPGFIIGITAHEEDISLFRKEFDLHCLNIIEASHRNKMWKRSILNAIEYRQTNNIDRSSMSKNTLCVTIHGIESRGDWQQRLKSVVNSHTNNVDFEIYKYGIFSILLFLIPFARNIEVYRFRNAFKKILERHPDKTIYLICHSFGTFVASKALESLSKNELKNLRYLVLAGSVLKTSYSFDSLQKNSSCTIINECGSDDFPLLISEALVPNTGMAGRVGFKGSNNNSFMNRFFDGGHSHYFDNENAFMRKNWLPLFESGYTPNLVDERSNSYFRDSVTNSTISLLGRIKNFAYIAIFSYLLLLVLQTSHN